MRAQSGAILGRGHPDVTFENAVEAGDGTEPGRENDFGDALGRISQKRFRFFDAHASHIFGKREASGFLEKLAKVKSAHMHVVHHLA